MLVESALYLIARINAPLMCRAQINLPLDVGVKYANGIPRMLRRIAGILIDWLESAENVFRTQAPNQANYQGNVQHGYTRQEVAKPVLGSQPPPPGTVPIRYVETETQEPSMELALSQPYYQERDYEWQEPQVEFIDVRNTQQDFNEESNSMMLVGPIPPYSAEIFPTISPEKISTFFLRK